MQSSPRCVRLLLVSDTMFDDDDHHKGVMMKVGMLARQLTLGLGVLAVGVGMTSGVAFAQDATGLNSQSLASHLPTFEKMLNVAPYSYALLPGHGTFLDNYALAKRLAALPNLPSQVKDLLVSTPVTVSANPTVPSDTSDIPGDPVMNGGCIWKDIYGFTVVTFSSYLGFSANGSVVTQVSIPNNHEDVTGWALGTITYNGSSFRTSTPLVNTWHSTAQVSGFFTQSVGGETVDQLGAQIDFNMYGNGAWSNPTTCSGGVQS